MKPVHPESVRRALVSNTQDKSSLLVSRINAHFLVWYLLYLERTSWVL